MEVLLYLQNTQASGRKGEMCKKMILQGKKRRRRRSNPLVCLLHFRKNSLNELKEMMIQKKKLIANHTDARPDQSN